jgi:hypothetical protein
LAPRVFENQGLAQHAAEAMDEGIVGYNCHTLFF